MIFYVFFNLLYPILNFEFKLCFIFQFKLFQNDVKIICNIAKLITKTPKK